MESNGQPKLRACMCESHRQERLSCVYVTKGRPGCLEPLMRVGK